MEITRKVNVFLWIAILLFPWFFSWFLLKNGYSNLARTIAFSWLVFIIFFTIPNDDQIQPVPKQSTSPQIVLKTENIEENVKPIKVNPKKLRSDLLADYNQTIQNANPHLNFIKSKYTKAKNGYALWAVHEYFSSYSLSIGPDAKTISDWIDDHRDELEQAQVVRIGLMNKEDLLGSAWFDLKK